MDQIIGLRPEESVRLNPDPLSEIYRHLGPVCAENILCRAMEELAHKLHQAETRFRDGRRGDLRRTCRLISAIADQIGLHDLAAAAGHVLCCLASEDPVALSATMARLLRLGDVSLIAVRENENLSL